MLDSTERFSNRVEDYVRYRPHYPREVVDCLKINCQLKETAVIADVGSGTGILTKLFLDNGNPVFAVEPNPNMRVAGEGLLESYPRFHSIPGQAEDTTLADRSVDFITAGQAFHWFDRAKARAEFKRILKSHGWVVLIWNERRKASSRFAQAYENLLQCYATDYERLDHQQVTTEVIAQFFGASYGQAFFEHRQRFDFEGVKGRPLSSSYAPDPSHPRHAAMIEELGRIFETHKTNDEVVFDYDARVFYGRLL